MRARNKKIQVELDAWSREHSDALEKLETIRVRNGVRRGRR
jgi:hypothetical protein